MAKNSIMFSHDAGLHGTHEYIESWVHLNIRIALNSNLLLQKQFKQNYKMYLLIYLMDFDNSCLVELALI